MIQALILFSHSALRKGVPITSPGMDQNYAVINTDDNIIKSIGNVAHGIVFKKVVIKEKRRVHIQFNMKRCCT